MSEAVTRPDERRVEDRPAADVRTAARKFGWINFVAGLLGFVGPAVWGNDDDLINVEPGLFLGVVAVNGPHALLHVLYGALGIRASRDSSSARGFMGLGAALFSAMAVMGWRAFGFERGVHMMMGLAADGWANIAHGLFAGIGLAYALRPEADPSDERS